MFGYVAEFNDHYIKLLEMAEYEESSNERDIAFEYQSDHHDDLQRLKQKYDLEQVAGDGDELSQILNLMRWVDGRLQHGDVMPPQPCHALHVLDLVERESIPMNCYTIATVLNEVYLSMGFYARRVHCRSYDAYDGDSHVITLIFSRTLKKWLYMDASWNTFVTDDQGELLSLEEFRYRLSHHLPVWVNGDPSVSEWSTFYLGYMAKNLFWFMSPLQSEYDYEASRLHKTYCALFPAHFEPIDLRSDPPENISVCIRRHPNHFWTHPTCNTVNS
ncbi:hypothetical protein BVG16_26505 [Paenibacillus selenitireducens]|uniref:Transglutaminase-like domain-containing protein n=1 Tax=Paenibacillus selenitireducens TaxID=1324314 RepID=A0A1T2X299_9BACL|nr:hypothetical protein [Paenibacillus selenitireducens]OPA73992.1 hypothetical protein BVG16_26505 [Paenibacillus selenitireducens]